MRNKPYPIFAGGLLILAILACNFGAPAPTSTPYAQGTNILTLAAQTLEAQTPTAEQGISVEAALTLAVETLQAQATPTNTTAPSDPPTSKPKKTKTPKPTNTPTSPATVATTSGTLHLHFPIGQITFVAPIKVVPVTPNRITKQAQIMERQIYPAGFSPDPYSVGMTTGGNVDVSYLGGSCSGFATTHPDLRINFGGGGSSLLPYIFCRLQWRPRHGS